MVRDRGSSGVSRRVFQWALPAILLCATSSALGGFVTESGELHDVPSDGYYWINSGVEVDLYASGAYEVYIDAGATVNLMAGAEATLISAYAGSYLNMYGGIAGSGGISAAGGSAVTIYGVYGSHAPESGATFDTENDQLVPDNPSSGWTGDVTFAYEGDSAPTEIGFSVLTNIQFASSSSGNQAPLAYAGGNVTILSSAQPGTTLQGTADDPDEEDALQYRWLEVLTSEEVVLLDWTDVVRSASPPDPAPLDLSMLAAFSGGAHTLKLEVTDGEATSSDVMVLSVFGPPEIISVEADNADPVEKGTEVTITTVFEALPGDPVEAVITWGDGQSTELSDVSSPLETKHVYSDASVYTVGVTLSNSGGSSDPCSYEYVVVYDPDAYSFVSGAGWYDEPLAPRGKAFFGLFVRQWGGFGPCGRLRVRWGADRFRATSIDWLVVEDDGSAAWFAGYGTINGAGDYYFMVELGDDSIWITIFDEYDTGGLKDLIRGRIRIRTCSW